MNRRKIVAIGDSLTCGYPYTPACSWVRVAADRLAVAIINKGVCGETTADMRRRFAADVVALRPDWVIITGGSNDAFWGTGAGEVAANMLAMVNAAAGSGIRPAVGLPPPMNFPEEALLNEYRRTLRALALGSGLPIIDFYRPLLAEAGGGLRPGLTVDGVHPNEDGYELMAGAAVAALAGLLE